MFDKKNRFVDVRTLLSKILLSLNKILNFIKNYRKKNKSTSENAIKSENETIIQNAENAIEAMGYLHQQIVYRSTRTNPNFFNDILHYYPGLLQSSYRDNGNFAHIQLAMIGEWGIEDQTHGSGCCLHGISPHQDRIRWWNLRTS